MVARGGAYSVFRRGLTNEGAGAHGVVVGGARHPPELLVPRRSESLCRTDSELGVLFDTRNFEFAGLDVVLARARITLQAFCCLSFIILSAYEILRPRCYERWNIVRPWCRAHREKLILSPRALRCPKDPGLCLLVSLGPGRRIVSRAWLSFGALLVKGEVIKPWCCAYSVSRSGKCNWLDCGVVCAGTRHFDLGLTWPLVLQTQAPCFS